MHWRRTTEPGQLSILYPGLEAVNEVAPVIFKPAITSVLPAGTLRTVTVPFTVD
jgi:hypothetical protein